MSDDPLDGGVAGVHDSRVPRRNDNDAEVWSQATSAATVASVARLEALANVEAQNAGVQAPESTDEEFSKHGCRLGYSSVLAVKSREEAQSLLASIFTVALMRNPLKEIGGMLFYDEQTNAIVQVLEGPAVAVRELFYEKIASDTRHTAVKVLWDLDVSGRCFEGFGMKLGSDTADVLRDGAEASDQQGLLQLSYMSRLTATSRETAYADIQDILRCAIFHNPKLHIGGALFLNPRSLHVLQVLEGPQANVRTLYDKIARDARHDACKVLSEEVVGARSYEQWGMLQGDSSKADWSSLRGWNDQRRRRGKDDVFEGDGLRDGLRELGGAGAGA